MPVTPTPGATALAAGFTLWSGTGLLSDVDDFANRSLDEVAAKYLPVSGAVTIAQGGTGATTAAGARTNLGVDPVTLNVWGNSGAVAAGYNAVLGFNGSRLQYYVPGYAVTTEIANKAEALMKSGDTMSGDLYLGSASTVTSSYVALYRNGDGRVGLSPSAERFKKYISLFAPEALGDIFPEFHRFQLRSQQDSPSDNQWRYGPIADRMLEHPDQARFVVLDEEGQPLTIDFQLLHTTQIAQLHQRAVAAEARVDALEARLAAIEAHLGLAA